MTRTQIQLPDSLYARAKKYSEEHELSLAEMARRGLEMFLDRFPAEPKRGAKWKMPVFDGGGLKVPLERLHDISAEEQEMRGLPRK